MEAFRITTKKWANKLTASGFAARWNSEGIFVLYAAENRSLACLENLVHRNGFGLDDNFCVITISIPDNLKTAEISINDLPEGWDFQDEAAHLICRNFGNQWILDQRAAILKVPSAIVTNEFNILINPNHKDFDKIVIKSIEKFTFDNRLKNKKN